MSRDTLRSFSREPLTVHHGSMATPRMRTTTAALIAMFSVSGVLHLLRPEPFIAIVPQMLPRKRDLVYASGVAELAGATLMAAPRTRRRGGTLSAVLLVAVFPANVSMALAGRRRPLRYRVLAWGRLPLQVPLVLWAWRSGRE